MLRCSASARATKLAAATAHWYLWKVGEAGKREGSVGGVHVEGCGEWIPVRRRQGPPQRTPLALSRASRRGVEPHKQVGAAREGPQPPRAETERPELSLSRACTPCRRLPEPTNAHPCRSGPPQGAEEARALTWSFLTASSCGQSQGLRAGGCFGAVASARQKADPGCAAAISPAGRRHDVLQTQQRAPPCGLKGPHVALRSLQTLARPGAAPKYPGLQAPPPPPPALPPRSLHGARSRPSGPLSCHAAQSLVTHSAGRSCVKMLARYVTSARPVVATAPPRRRPGAAAAPPCPAQRRAAVALS